MGRFVCNSWASGLHLLDDVAEGVPPLSQRMVGSETQFQELQREQDTQHIGQDLLMQNGNWIKPFGHQSSIRTLSVQVDHHGTRPRKVCIAGVTFSLEPTSGRVPCY